MNSKKIKITKVEVLVVTAILIVIISIGINFKYNTTENTYIITVTDKERVVQSNSSKYLVFGKDENGDSRVFQNTDTFWKWKWNSSDVQGELNIGNKYQITVVGYRVPFFSMYENIIEVTPIE